MMNICRTAVTAMAGCQELADAGFTAAKSVATSEQFVQTDAASEACEWSKSRLSEENWATCEHVSGFYAGDSITGGTCAIGTAAVTNEVTRAETGFATRKPMGLIERMI